MVNKNEVFSLYLARISAGKKVSIRDCYEEVFSFNDKYKEMEEEYKHVPKGYTTKEFINALYSAYDDFFKTNAGMVPFDDGYIKEPLRKILREFGYKDENIDSYIRHNEMDQLKEYSFSKMTDIQNIDGFYKYMLDNGIIKDLEV